MVSFALVTEGITDQAILENILNGFFNEDVQINFLNPLRDCTDENRAASFSNWEKVFEYCEQSEFKESLQFNDFVIVQIDTDTAEHPNFGVSLTTGGIQRTAVEIIAEVKTLIAQKIGLAFFQTYQQQIIFAVAVHSMECWLLPLYETGKPNTQTNVLNCYGRLCRVLAKNKVDSSKNYANYLSLSHDFSKRKNLTEAAKHNESLLDFVNQLPTAQAQN
jgi:hypothetical protein